jgi:hypothetical protein
VAADMEDAERIFRSPQKFERQRFRIAGHGPRYWSLPPRVTRARPDALC